MLGFITYIRDKLDIPLTDIPLVAPSTIFTDNQRRCYQRYEAQLGSMFSSKDQEQDVLILLGVREDQVKNHLPTPKRWYLQ